MDTIDEGYVLLSRKLLDNPIFKDREALQLFVYGLLTATHKDMKVIHSKGEVLLKRGQFITAIRPLSRATGQTPKQIRNRLALLENAKIWALKRAHTFSIVTICNYDYYQTPENYKGHTKGHSEGTVRAQEQEFKNLRIKRYGRRKDPADPRVKDFLDFWGETFFQETEQPYVFSFAKEGKIVKHLLQVHPMETLSDVTRRFFRDEQAKRRGLTIGIFSQEINRLVGIIAMDPLEQAKRERARSQTEAQP